MFIVIVYDIPDNKRRTRLFKLLKRYGDHAQYSVFECETSASKFKELQRAIYRFIDPREDDVRFYEFCLACRQRAWTIGQTAAIHAQPQTLVL